MTRWDDIVVGSGPIGACVARRLAEAGRRVLIVERGRAVSTPPGGHLRNLPGFRADPDGWFAAVDTYLDYLAPDAPASALPGAFTTSVVGGCGILWTNNCPRAVIGVDRPDLLTDAEWQRAYATAERYLDVRADEYGDSRRARAVHEELAPALARDGRTIGALPLAGRRLSAEHIHYVGPADVLADSDAAVERLVGEVERVELASSRVTGVRVDGVVHEANHVVLATGALDTPLILWRSGLDPPALGSRLSLHPVLATQVVLAEHLSAADDDPLPRLAIPPTVGHPWLVMVLRDTNPLAVAPVDRDIPAGRLIELQAFAPVDPHPDNRMWVGPSGEARFELPLRPADQERMRAIERDVDSIVARIGRTRSGCERRWAPLDTAHLLGSCRMGAQDDGTSVADPSGMVWGVEGLQLATNGLIPTRLAVNPTLTTAALALRAVERLVG